MVDALSNIIRKVGTAVTVTIVIAIVMVLFAIGEATLGKLFGGAFLGLLFAIRFVGSNLLESKVETIVEDKANSIFGHLEETVDEKGGFDPDEAFARYMKKRDAGLTEAPPPDIGAIRQFGRKGQ